MEPTPDAGHAQRADNIRLAEPEMEPTPDQDRLLAGRLCEVS